MKLSVVIPARHEAPVRRIGSQFEGLTPVSNDHSHEFGIFGSRFIRGDYKRRPDEIGPKASIDFRHA